MPVGADRRGERAEQRHWRDLRPQVDGRPLDPVTVAEAGANTMMILDASGSMAGAAGGGTSKMAAAKDAITRYVVGCPESSTPA